VELYVRTGTNSCVSQYLGFSYQYLSNSAIRGGQSGTVTVVSPSTSGSHISILPTVRFVADTVGLGQFCIPILRVLISVSYQQCDLWRTQWHWDSCVSQYFGFSYQYLTNSAIRGGHSGTGTVLYPNTSGSHISIFPKVRFVADKVAL